MTDTIVQRILFDPRLLRNQTYNGRRFQFKAGKMKETAKFALLREFGYRITERSKPNGGVEIHIDPPETESEIFQIVNPQIFKKPSQ